MLSLVIAIIATLAIARDDRFEFVLSSYVKILLVLYCGCDPSAPRQPINDRQLYRRDVSWRLLCGPLEDIIKYICHFDLLASEVEFYRSPIGVGRRQIDPKKRFPLPKKRCGRPKIFQIFIKISKSKAANVVKSVREGPLRTVEVGTQSGYPDPV